MTTRRIRCAGGIAFDADGRLLMIQRGTAPAVGNWSIPGGKGLPDESAEQTCVRELREETGLEVSVTGFAGRVERGGPGGAIFVIDDFTCSVTGGQLQAGDDASDVGWVSRAELTDLPVVPGLIDALTEWNLLPS